MQSIELIRKMMMILAFFKKYLCQNRFDTIFIINKFI